MSAAGQPLQPSFSHQSLPLPKGIIGDGANPTVHSVINNENINTNRTRDKSSVVFFEE